MVAVWAYAYEFKDVSLVSDGAFDEVCRQVERDIKIKTGKPHLDNWFLHHFQAHTGQWIHHHPELRKVAETYDRYFADAD